LSRTNGNGGKLVPKLLLAYRKRSAMSQTELARWLCIPVCSAAFAFAGDDRLVQHPVAGLASGGQCVFYVWAKVADGTKQVSIAIVDNAYASYLVGPRVSCSRPTGSGSESPVR
jgi:hypothetical protein